MSQNQDIDSDEFKINILTSKEDVEDDIKVQFKELIEE